MISLYMEKAITNHRDFASEKDLTRFSHNIHTSTHRFIFNGEAPSEDI